MEETRFIDRDDERFAAYVVERHSDGSPKNVDIEAMLVDVVGILKTSNCPKKEFLRLAGFIFDSVKLHNDGPPN
jgi:hypothetical protein